MKFAKRVVLGAVVVAGVFGVGAGQASGEPASSLDCSFIDPDLGGRVVMTSSGQFLVNCWEHTAGGAAPTGGSAELVDCSEALEMPMAQGISVTTPQGNVYVNCHVHF